MDTLTDQITRRSYYLYYTTIPDCLTGGLSIFVSPLELKLEIKMGKDESRIKIQKEHIIKLQVYGGKDQKGEEPFYNSECPELIIFHNDPHGVINFFETRIRDEQSYWILALAKILKDTYGIESESRID